MGSSTVFSNLYGAKKIDKLKNSFFISSCLIGLLSLVINFLALFFIDDILFLLKIPQEIWGDTKTYLQSIRKVPIIRLKRKHFHFDMNIVKMIGNNSILTSIQQSVMNLGILMIQGLVNSFGVSVMAAFAAVVKIESFAYLPEQELGNAFSTFIAQNHGAKERGRIRNGIRSAIKIITIYGVTVSALIILLAKPIMSIFIDPNETEIIQIGIQYLFIVASFYCLIGYLFMLYGLYRGIGKPGMSIILTVVSLGTRVILAYTLSSVPSIGLKGIWWAIPIGWALADIIDFYRIKRSC